MKLLAGFLLSIFLMIALVAPAHAAEFKAVDGDTVVPKNENTKDLHVSGRDVTVDSDIGGDLVLAGSNAIINGKTEHSLFVFAGSVVVNGDVGRHVRIAGGTVTLAGSVGGDVFIAGGTVTIASDVSIQGGLYVGGGTVTMNGTVVGPVKIAGQGTTINGSLSDGATIYSEAVTIGPLAVIEGDVEYTASKEANIDSAATVNGKITFHQRSTDYSETVRNLFSIFSLLTLLGSMLVLLILVRYLPTFSASILGHGTKKTLPAIGAGFLLLIIVPVLCIALLFTVVGIPLALFAGVLWLLLIMAGSLYGKLILGAWVIKALTKEPAYRLDLQAIVVGVLLTALVALIPVVGWLVSFFTFLLGIGAIVLMFSGIRSVSVPKQK
jgi:cytoskeletal protein CcmA (bactofilin family)